jgi:hypothetical protein
VTAKRLKDLPSPLAAASGCAVVALFLSGAVVIGERPPFDTSGQDLVAFIEAERTRIQIAVGLSAAAAPFFICFLATVGSLTAEGGRAVRQAGLWLFGCGLGFIVLFLADLTALAVSAMRPQTMAASPEVALALLDFEFVAMGVASFSVVAMLLAAALLALRHGVVWPRWIGGLAAVAAVLYLLRAGTLFTADGVFAADGVFGLWVPVGALVAWLLAASTVLARDLRRGEVAGVGAG